MCGKCCNECKSKQVVSTPNTNERPIDAINMGVPEYVPPPSFEIINGPKVTISQSKVDDDFSIQMLSRVGWILLIFAIVCILNFIGGA